MTKTKTASPTRPAPASGSGAEAKAVVRGVSRWFKDGTVHALDDVSFEIGQGEFVSLVGPSGCGKTTLLRVLDGLIAPDGGEVIVDGAPPRPGPHIGFMFQQSRLLPWLTVRRNVELPLTLQGARRAERTEHADAMLTMVGLSEFADCYPRELSGGMQQRVGLARAFIGSPGLLLMDEPFVSLDAMTREFMRTELLKTWHTRRTAVVFVTHDVDEAIYLAQRIVLLRPRPGRVDEILDVRLPERRWDLDVRDLPEFRALRDHVWSRVREMVGGSVEWAHTRAGEETDDGGR